MTERTLTDEDPRGESVSKVSVFVPSDVAEAYDVELSLSSTTRSIDWKQDRPSDEASNEANDGTDFEEPKE